MSLTRNQWINVALVVPVVLVNVFAVYGQAGWALDHLFSKGPDAARIGLAVMFAVTVESVGVYLAAEAHFALMAGDAALRLRVAAGTVAALVGGLNYHHYAPTLDPNTPAVTFAVMSAISPHLWAIRSRSLRRAELRAAGLIDARTVRFSVARWVLWFRPTWTAYRHAVWVGEQDPMKAIELTTPETVEDRPPPAVSDVAVTVEPAKTAPKPDADRARIVNAIVRDIRAGKPVSARSVRSTHRIGHAKASEYVTEARERVAQGQVVAINGGHQ